MYKPKVKQGIMEEDSPIEHSQITTATSIENPIQYLYDSCVDIGRGGDDLNDVLQNFNSKEEKISYLIASLR